MVVFDQLIKWWGRAALTGQPAESYFWGTVTLVHSENTGAFLSLGAEWPQPVRTAVFIVLVLGYLAFAGYVLLRKSTDVFAIAGLTCLIAGGVGNLIDRVLKGSVTDYIVMGIGPLRTGVFNLADFAIVVGIILLLLEGRFQRGRS